MTAPSPPTADWLRALRHSHQRLFELVNPLGDDDVSAQSYDTEWSIAQVLSHLGSGAEIFGLFVSSALEGKEAPDFDRFQPIWDSWNAKPAPDQAHDSLRADADFVDALDGLTAEQRESWQLSMFGMDARLADVARMRLSEHAVHSWDVAVALDPSATVAQESVDLMIDHLDQLVARVGKAPDTPVDVVVTTNEPTRTFRLRSTPDGVSLTPVDGDPTAGAATLELPAEAFIRLVYGRLDPDHTPPLKADGVDLDVLRAMFPGL